MTWFGSITIRAASSWGNDVGEGSYGELELSAFASLNNGALIDVKHVYTLNSGSLTQYIAHAAFEGDKVAIDTVQFGLVAAAHNFVNSGEVRVYGLVR